MSNNPFLLSSDGKHFNLAHGFLPLREPICELPAALQEWDKIAKHLPKLITNADIRTAIKDLPAFTRNELDTPEQFERAMMILSYLGHAYVWSNPFNPVEILPRILSIPWYQVAKQLGRPPVLSYASYALYNWYRLDPKRPIELGNIALLQNFLGGADEEWFILIHIDMEAKAVGALQALQPLQDAIQNNDLADATTHLRTIAESLNKVCNTLERMPEHCDPYIYFNRVRPYIHGWKNNPALPKGLVYEGVDEYQHQPMQFKGETGAQSTIMPCLDAVLGVDHEENPLKKHLEEMQIYMPPQHRQFLLYLQQQPSIRNTVSINHTTHPNLSRAYNDCIELINRFRNIHLNYATQYINLQTQASSSNPVDIGTGGTPFVSYLKKHQVETEQTLLS